MLNLTLCTNLTLFLPQHKTCTPKLFLFSFSRLKNVISVAMCIAIQRHNSRISNNCNSDVTIIVYFGQSKKKLNFLCLCMSVIVALTPVACFASLTCSPAIHLTLLFQIHFLMILSANWAYLKDASQMHAYQDIKMKEERELQDITSRSKECLNSYT